MFVDNPIIMFKSLFDLCEFLFFGSSDYRPANVEMSTYITRHRNRDDVGRQCTNRLTLREFEI